MVSILHFGFWPQEAKKKAKKPKKNHTHPMKNWYFGWN
jgi:hypothetical protein